jgi:hypothetical protein
VQNHGVLDTCDNDQKPEKKQISEAESEMVFHSSSVEENNEAS